LPPAQQQAPARAWITRAFSLVEDVVYVGLGLLLAAGALALLVSSLIGLGQSLVAGSLASSIVQLLDQILLILLVVELLYTLRVSVREHAVLPEPFLLIGLIAAIRRVLVITAEFGELGAKTNTTVQHFVMEIGALTALILALSLSLFALRTRGGAPVRQD
jgi:uncharacterized membrane protein (DUF373 family)